MNIFVPKEVHPGETRVPMIPDIVDRFVRQGAPFTVESGIGETCRYTDEAYEKVGATVSSDRAGSLESADVVLRLRKPPIEEIAGLKKGAIHVSFLDPFNEPALIDEMVKCGITSISMEMIPRTTLAQKMDALSSQANLAGYVAVILGAERMDKVLPMMMTPAGTIRRPAFSSSVSGWPDSRRLQPPRGSVLGLMPSIRARWWRSRSSRWARNSSRWTWGRRARRRTAMRRSSPRNSRKAAGSDGEGLCSVRPGHYHRPAVRPKSAHDRHQGNGRRT